MHRLRTWNRVPILGALLLMGFIGVVAAATPAGAEATACTRDGNQLSWTPTSLTVHVRGEVDDQRSAWVTAVSGANLNSYDLTASDLDKSTRDSFFIRFRDGGAVTNVACTDAVDPVGPVGPGFCVQDGTVLSWGDIDGPIERNAFQVRRVNNDGSRTWLGKVDDSAAHTFTVDSASASYEIRYRITSTPGNTTIVDEPCSTQAPPPAPPAPSPTGDINCRQTDGLTWDSVDGLIGRYQVREVNPDGSTSWVQSASSNSAFPATGDFSQGVFLIRYRVQGSDGNVEVIDSAICASDQPAPPDSSVPVTCSVDPFGFQTETGYDVIVLNATAGDSYTVFRNGVAGETASSPMPIDAFTNVNANTYFRTFTSQTTFIDVEIARTADPDTRISCGSFGTPEASFCTQTAAGLSWTAVPEAIGGEYTIIRQDFNPFAQTPVATTTNTDTFALAGDFATNQYFIQWSVSEANNTLVVNSDLCVPG